MMGGFLVVCLLEDGEDGWFDSSSYLHFVTGAIIEAVLSLINFLDVLKIS